MSTGRLTGLIASALLLIQVFLMARVPWVEQAWGQDELARTHRLVGFTSFNLHARRTSCSSPSATRRASSLGLWGTIVDLVVNYPGMLLAVAGTAALVMVVVTSVKKARRRLRYESWHLIHLYGYLGAGLALPHQLWTGTDFLASTDRDRLLVEPVRRVRRRRARLPGRAAAVALAARAAARRSTCGPRAPA